jgi:hypothetical protein
MSYDSTDHSADQPALIQPGELSLAFGFSIFALTIAATHFVMGIIPGGDTGNRPAAPTACCLGPLYA